MTTSDLREFMEFARRKTATTQIWQKSRWPWFNCRSHCGFSQVWHESCEGIVIPQPVLGCPVQR